MGIIGIGGIGKYHADNLLAAKIDGCELTAVADKNKNALKKFSNIKTFTNSSDLLKSGEVDAVHIATPHFLHTSIGIEALNAGLHVMVEKPISVHKKDCEALLAAHTNKKQIFSAMFNQRTSPLFHKLKQLIDNGELGEITRVNWIITDWFRTEAYYANGRWRATWKGEGGGVLLNQCPHQLDLLQWLCGPPSAVRGFAHLGARHNIEVEDQVTAYLEWPNKATGVFVTTTGETPGTNRLEIAAERGKIVVENERLTFFRNEMPMGEYSKTAGGGFDQPDVWHIEIPLPESPDQHIALLQNFTNAILHGEKLIAPAEEGIYSVELANAILYSSLTNNTIQMPLDADAYAEKLDKLIATSNYDKKVVKEAEQDMSKSF